MLETKRTTTLLALLGAAALMMSGPAMAQAPAADPAAAAAPVHSISRQNRQLDRWLIGGGVSLLVLLGTAFAVARAPRVRP